MSVATCQFPVGADIRSNTQYILKQMRIAKKRGAHVTHFCKGSLSGYAGVDFVSFEEVDWDLLQTCSQEILELAHELGLWVLLGSSHPLTGRRKPHNSVYITTVRL